jgi:hypothetical protein
MKNVLGYVLGDFFTNSSGHPGSDKRNSFKVENGRVSLKTTHPGSVSVQVY